jgi:DNA-directed RNA polymerase specialized sigma24 family protein
MTDRKKLSPDAGKRIALLYVEGLTITTIAVRMGVAPSTIRRTLDSLKIERRPLGFAKRIYK